LGLKNEQVKRIVFNEITKDAVLNAIENPRDIDNNLVDAQQARRILDRLVGFELSPVLWKKVKPSLSAGRVQSVAVRLIVEREREVRDFNPESYYKVFAIFQKETGEQFKAELNKTFKKKQEVEDFLNKCINAEFEIGDVQVKPSKKSPPAPFTTSTLQQEASRKLGYSVAQTMSIAQRLYESGKITYMRTDSVNLSGLAINTTKNEIVSVYGEKYSKVRKFKTKTKGAQEAHEAIRPTYINITEVEGSAQERKLYDLIRKRTLACQMTEAEFEKTVAKIKISNLDQEFVANGEILKFDGFLKAYKESNDNEEVNEDGINLLPDLNSKDKLGLVESSAFERHTHHPPRFTEASLVRKLEELGIGRPSTYAPVISTIQNRDYVIKEDRQGTERLSDIVILKDGKINSEKKKENVGYEKSKLFPTDIGIVVNDFLTEHFDKIMDYNFTASVEEEFDLIADGKMNWNEMIDKFYGVFHKKVEITLETSEKSKGERILGDDPESGKPVSVKIGRYGPIAQIGDKDDEEKPRFASLRRNQHLETITLEEALDLFKLPRNLGDFEGKEVSVAIGRFGPYVKHDNKFVSLKKGVDDPLEVSLERAVELIVEKREADKKKVIKTFEEKEGLQILNGRYGPYISFEKKNYRIPKTVKPEELTLEKCMEIIEKGPTTKRKGKKK
jgi:DNA topoisomerase-1